MAIENCPQCNAPRESADLKFCTSCGAPLGGAVPSSPEQSPPEQTGPENQADHNPEDVQHTQVLPQWEQPQQQWGGPAQQSQGQQPPQQWGAPQPGGPSGPGGPNGPHGPGQPWQQPPGKGGGGNGAKIALIVGLVVLLLAAAGITLALVFGGDDDPTDASTNASKSEFCKQTDKVVALEDNWSGADDVADDLTKVGTPEDMPEEARKGFEIIAGVLAKAKDEDDADGRVEALTKEEKSSLFAFGTYREKTCGSDQTQVPEPSNDLPSNFPSELPTEFPTDFPTDFPTEFPSDLLSDFPTEFLTNLPSGLPSDLLDLLTELPSDFGQN